MMSKIMSKIIYYCSNCNSRFENCVHICPVCEKENIKLFKDKFKKGDIVKTIKGDRFNKNARNEKLKVIKHLGFSQLGYRILCEKPNGIKTPFCAVNLRKISEE